jgi:hypothetical protein
VTRPRPICTVPICTKPVLAKGLCTGHYNRVWRTGDLDPETPLRSELYHPHPETHANGSKTKCDHGHFFTEENTATEYWPDGTFKSRRCRLCSLAKTQAKRKVNAE